MGTSSRPSGRKDSGGLSGNGPGRPAGPARGGRAAVEAGRASMKNNGSKEGPEPSPSSHGPSNHSESGLSPSISANPNHGRGDAGLSWPLSTGKPSEPAPGQGRSHFRTTAALPPPKTRDCSSRSGQTQAAMTTSHAARFGEKAEPRLRASLLGSLGRALAMLRKGSWEM